MKRATDILKQMTLDEKILMLTGYSPMGTEPIERLGVEEVIMADGPHGIRGDKEMNNTSFPCISCLASSWNRELAYKMGSAIADECINNNVKLLLAPGINIKRHLQCGRNFEYYSEDPIAAGEMAAAYVNGIQDKNVGVSVKHYAVNNQEKFRNFINVEVDRRTLFEIYLRAFEIVVKKSKPASIMSATNKTDGIWCSEHKYLLTDVLRGKWNFEGFVISDWDTVRDSSKALKAGMDLQMPTKKDILPDIKEGLKSGEISEADIDRAVLRILDFALKEKAKPIEYDREKQHRIAKEIAREGIVLLKNENRTLPVTKEKYKKITIFGEYAKNPLIRGQGSSEVYVDEKYVETPLCELKKALGDDVEIAYIEYYKKLSYLDEMIWPKFDEFRESIEDSDLVMFFIGSMESEDTEEFDRRSPYFNPNFEFFINQANALGKKTAVVMQTGSAVIFDSWNAKTDAIVEMWLGGEGAGSAIAEVLTGKYNPSGKLSETFPIKAATHLDYPGDGVKIEYKEKLNVGYRYYDRHTSEINYPFGHGLSYTEFEYSDISVSREKDEITVSCTVENTGGYDGAEIVQVYAAKEKSGFTRPLKELKGFAKAFINKGESKRLEIKFSVNDLAYFNTSLDEWITEPGEYTIYVGASSQDIRLKASLDIPDSVPYTVDKENFGVGML